MKKNVTKSIDQQAADLSDKLPREEGWRRANYHKGCNWYGRIYALYVYRLKNWLKVGEYCGRCSAVHVYKRFKDGLPR